MLRAPLTAALTMILAASALVLAAPAVAKGPPDPARFATFNASLNRFSLGALAADLSTRDNAQAKAVAEIIQRTAPDVLLINEFDYDPAALDLFRGNYLEVSQNGADPIEYPYAFIAPSNTGVPSGFDLNNNGSIGGPDDALGFGFFPGQFGMAVYSRHPIQETDIRTFRTFLWADMPGALLPTDPTTGEAWYTDAELDVLPLSSKSHWDIPISIGGSIVHFLVSHPTPPVFDGLEDRNGRRNFDEIRLWADYVTPGAGDYIYDDAGVFGGLRPGSRFVIAGDQNSDPLDGDSIPGSIQQLLDNPRVNATFTPSSAGAVEAAALQGGANLAHRSDPAFDTADFNDNPAPGNLRADYVLPSRQLRIVDGAVFWPVQGEPLFRLTGVFPFPSSDHRLVWVDVMVPGSARGS
ncbi:MAG: endonuclease/exonuclease/phosphatase family protein [Chloroflexota bacterium]|nr:endonuclease/exonuclease/phosphatase family protein [Chloroflexota bacterium]